MARLDAYVEVLTERPLAIQEFDSNLEAVGQVGRANEVYLTLKIPAPDRT